MKSLWSDGVGAGGGGVQIMKYFLSPWLVDKTKFHY